MDNLTSISSAKFAEKSDPIKDLHDHENFTIDGIKIYPELVECAEHFVLACHKNPGFVSKIINAEYDLLIGDDVSGRPVTLMIKYILDNYRKQNYKKLIYSNLQGRSNIKLIDNIFVDPPRYDAESQDINKIKMIINSHKTILICTEFIMMGHAIRDIIDLVVDKKSVDVFSQGNIDFLPEPTNNTFGINNIYIGTSLKSNAKIRETGRHLVGLKSTDLLHSCISKTCIGSVNNTRKQIKLLSNYIIKNYLKT